MKEEVRKEIIHDLSETANVLQVKEQNDLDELKILSEHAIENIAIYKDLELVSVTVLIYSLYKIENSLTSQARKKILNELKQAADSLRRKKFGRYNSAIKILYKLVRNCNARIKEHLQDVMDAARIKKGTSLLQHGLSIGQAAGLMGLSNWDLQAYVGKTNILTKHTEVIPAKKRLRVAFNFFGIKG
jgi:hypothetical protein